MYNHILLYNNRYYKCNYKYLRTIDIIDVVYYFFLLTHENWLILISN